MCIQVFQSDATKKKNLKNLGAFFFFFFFNSVSRESGETNEAQ